MTTKSQPTTTKLEASEPTLKMCDYRNKECAAYGVTVGGKWICNNHICEQRQRCWLSRNARVSDGVPTVDHEAIAKRLDYAAWVGFNQSDSEFEKGYKHAMGVAAQVVRDAAASAVAPQQSEPQHLTINGQRRMVIPCPDGKPDCEVLHTAPALSALFRRDEGES